jgi:hypothetical protein
METSRCAPLPVRPRRNQRAQDGGRGVRGGQDVGGLEIGHARRRLVALLEVHEPRRGVDDVGERRPRAPRTGLAEARDRAVNDVRFQRADRLVIAPEPRDHARQEVLHDDVRDLGQIVDDGLPVGSRHVDAHAFLAGVHAGEVGALVAAPVLELKIVVAHLVAAARTLDLDHAGAEVAEQARAVRPRQDAGQVQDGDADQRQIAGGAQGPGQASRTARLSLRRSPSDSLKSWPNGADSKEP